ncbi:MAG: 3-phosphoshikimate 1-carboxyvinyltransferase [Gemmataceae bacterium]
MNGRYPEQIEIRPVQLPVQGTATPPGSKSLTNRALVLAALAGHRVTLHGCLESEDTAVMVQALRQLGYQVTIEGTTFHVQPGPPPDSGAAGSALDLFVGNSGTTIRFLTAMLALRPGSYRLDGVSRMRQRPIADLIDALGQLGIQAEAPSGCPPVTLRGGGWKGGRITLRTDVSSQFLSGLLLAAPFADCDSTGFRLEGPLVSEPYVFMTLKMLQQWGLQARIDLVPGRQRTTLTHYVIEPDASAASYLFAVAAITGGQVTVAGLTRRSLQGDVAFVDALAQMGCRVDANDAGITVQGGPLHGISLDMNAISDTVMTLAAVALFADGPTHLTNVGHIRHKETDRLHALATELRRLGARVDEEANGLRIQPGPLQGCVVQTYDDHRMAMSLALAGLRVPGVVIDNPACVAKTYPAFFDDLERLTKPFRSEASQ